MRKNDLIKSIGLPASPPGRVFLNCNIGPNKPVMEHEVIACESVKVNEYHEIEVNLIKVDEKKHLLVVCKLVDDFKGFCRLFYTSDAPIVHLGKGQHGPIIPDFKDMVAQTWRSCQTGELLDDADKASGFYSSDEVKAASAAIRNETTFKVELKKLRAIQARISGGLYDFNKVRVGTGPREMARIKKGERVLIAK